MPDCDGCPTVDINQCGWAFCTHLLLGATSVSSNGMGASGLASSAVNMMEGPTQLMCCENSSLCDCCCMTKVSSKYLVHIKGGFTAFVMALCSNDSIYKLATMGLTGDPMAAPLVC